MPNDYWSGIRQATLARAQISAPWGGPGVEHSGRSIALANRAFEIYYEAHRRISACPDRDHRALMLDSLHEAARSGWGVGVDDLEEAFQHLADNGGTWTDAQTAPYSAGPEQAFPGTLTTGPVSCVNFLKAVDSRMAQLKAILERYRGQVHDISQAQQRDDWSTVATVLSQTRDWGERAKPFLWWAPSVERGVGTVVTFVGALSNIQAGLTTYANSVGAGLGGGAAAALGALRTAMGWVPVLGDFYGAAIDMIPGLRAWFVGLVREHCRRIDAAAAGRPY